MNKQLQLKFGGSITIGLATGERGPQGPQGATGVNGQTGATGETGLAGVTGLANCFDVDLSGVTGIQGISFDGSIWVPSEPETLITTNGITGYADQGSALSSTEIGDLYVITGEDALRIHMPDSFYPPSTIHSWSFEDAGVSSLSDSIGGNTFTLTSSTTNPIFGSARTGSDGTQSIDFATNSSNGYYEAEPICVGQDRFIIQLWVKVSNISPGSNAILSVFRLAARGSNTTGMEFMFKQNDGNFYFRHNGLAPQTFAYTLDAWHHIAVVHDSGTSKVYRDGVLQVTETGTYVQPDALTDNFYIGSSWDTVNRTPRAMLDDMRVLTFNESHDPTQYFNYP